MTLTCPTLAHVRAVKGKLHGGVKSHPQEADCVFYVFGANVVASNQEQTRQEILYGHSDEITAFAISKGGRMLASGQLGHDADVLVWNVEQQVSLFRFEEHAFEVCELAFSFDDRLLASAGSERDQKLVIWDMSSGKIVSATRFHEKRPTALAWSPGNGSSYSLAAAFGAEATIWRLDPYTGTLVGSEVVTGSVKRSMSCLLFSDDGLWLFGGTMSGDVVRINTQRNALQVLHSVCSLGVGDMLLLDDGRIFVGGGDGSLTYFEKDNMRVNAPAVQLGNFRITSISLSSDQKEFIVGTGEGSIFRISVCVEEHAVVPLMETQRGCCTSAVFSLTNSEEFATTSEDGTVAIWHVEDQTLLRRIGVSGSGGATCSQLWEDKVISGWSDGHIRCHSQVDGKQIWKLNNAHRIGSAIGVSALALGCLNDIIISGGNGGVIRVWDEPSLGIVSHMKQHSASITAIRSFRDNIHVASCSKDGCLKLWDFVRETCLTSFMVKMGGINGMVLSPDQVQIVSVGQDRCITFWDIRCPHPQQVIQNAHAGDVTSVGITKNGSLMATGGADKVVRLWDVKGGAPIANLDCHTAAITATEYSPSGETLISTACDGSIAWWK